MVQKSLFMQWMICAGLLFCREGPGQHGPCWFRYQTSPSPPSMVLYVGCPVPLLPVDKQESDSDPLGMRPRHMCLPQPRWPDLTPCGLASQPSRLASEPGKLKEPVSTSTPIMKMDRMWFSSYSANGTNPGSTFWGENQHAGTTDPNLHQGPASHWAQCAFQASVARNNIALLAYLLTELATETGCPIP
ncbi:hypothetical protein GBF38_019578 [Nibea albiflora]|uniref:Uncharacterized protein n=1 Tax=Nibea albiflora TaxID=240163 RepID=A0ACB7F3B6_NIBAL|nr:hypothetical protein GBF38_019578 [Nibea albiflora]